jgi:hypothetical protein
MSLFLDPGGKNIIDNNQVKILANYYGIKQTHPSGLDNRNVSLIPLNTPYIDVK